MKGFVFLPIYHSVQSNLAEMISLTHYQYKDVWTMMLLVRRQLLELQQLIL